MQRIIITDCDEIKASKFLNDVKRINPLAETAFAGKKRFVEVYAPNDKLYEICSAAAVYILSTEVEKIANEILHIEYPNFSREERSLIVKAVAANDEFSELTGRLYIYLKHGGCVNLSGFFYFMCRDFSKKIYDIVCDEADKILSVSDMEDFIALLRYFASVSPVCCERADIFAKDNSLFLSVGKTEKASFDEEYAMMDFSCEDTLSELVALNPQKIVVHGKEFYENTEIASVIGGIFGDKITFCGGCAECKKSF